MEQIADPLFCSFCGKNQNEVSSLVVGPGVYICDECVWLCVEFLQNQEAQEFRNKPLIFQIIADLRSIEKLSGDALQQAGIYISCLHAGLPASLSDPDREHVEQAE